MDRTVTIQDMAVALGRTSRRLQRRAKQEGWHFTEKGAPGGRQRLYSATDLPRDVRDALAKHLIQSAATERAVQTVPSPETPTALKDWQRKAMEARLALLSEVARLAPVSGLMAAREAVAAAAGRGELPPALQALVPLANQRGGRSGGRAISVSILRRWEADFERGGAVALAPRPTRPERALPPEWLVDFLRLYAQPSKPSVRACYEAWAPAVASPPSLRTVQLEIQKLDALTRSRGRMGSRARKAMSAYVVRDTSALWPTAVYTADGHTLDAEVAHPLTGKPFRPEITSVVDVKTRRIVGWSVALAEATWGVLDALRHAVTTAGVPDIWYVDLGKGFNNAAFDAAETGFLGRLGITKTNSLPYNSQARGVVERLHQSVWVRGAKELPTYMGAAMDPQARQAVFKATRSEVKRISASRLLLPWADFIAWCGQQVEAYNARPHASLARILDPLTLQRRQQSPDEAWQAAMAEGWRPDPVTGPEAEDLFRPQEKRRVRRAMVSLFGNSYFAPELERFHEEEVFVAYDIHDASRVWIRDREQRLVCEAHFEGNRAAYFPVSVIEQAHERRQAGRLARIEAKRAEIEAENRPALIEAKSAPVFDAGLIAAGEAAFARLIETPAAPEPEPDGARPIFRSDLELARWALAHPERMTPQDAELLRACLARSSFRDLMEIEGIAATTLRELVTNNRRVA